MKLQERKSGVFFSSFYRSVYLPIIEDQGGDNEGREKEGKKGRVGERGRECGAVFGRF
jgi:hypothetical protein